VSEATTGRGAGAGVAALLSDDRLTRRAIDGDQRAFTAIFNRYHQSLYRYCLAIVGNPQDAGDALQNTMVKILSALPGEQRRIELKPWLYRIAHNESVELLRRRRDAEQLDPELTGTGTGLAEEAAMRERLRHLIADLDQLPERQRGALVMRELGGLGFSEIGAALGTSAAVARQTLYEARLGLRQMDEGREMSCETVARALSDADGRVARRRDIRAHLRDCSSCRRFREEINDRRGDLAALSPLPAAASAALLHGLLGGSGGSAGAGLAGAVGMGTAKSAGASLALKSAATVAVVAAIGVTAADRGGLIHHGSEPPEVTPPTPTQGEVAAGRRGASAPRPQLNGAARVEPGPDASAGKEAVRNSSSVSRNAGPVNTVAGAQAEAPGGSKEINVPPSSDAPAAHPHGRGHAKELPAASAHGQETAASHKATSQAKGNGTGHSAAPAKPIHPHHPSNPSAEKTAPPPASNAHGHEADPNAGQASQPSDGEEGAAPPGHGGKS
jgi:RNA polymerase sigma factor (sigma-70 family)